MNCKEYAPLVSRYLDEDMEGRELESFLDHLSVCAACQKELDGVERLRGWLQAADAQQGVPGMRGEWGLEALLENEPTPGAVEAPDALSPIAYPTRPEGEGARPRIMAWIRGLFTAPPIPRHAMRFALPLLVVGVAATWFYLDHTSDWIDVHDLQSSPTAAVSFPPEESDQIEYYVVQHATHQPWEQYGDEVPMLQLASTPSR
jgi:hypothetical protein